MRNFTKINPVLKTIWKKYLFTENYEVLAGIFKKALFHFKMKTSSTLLHGSVISKCSAVQWHRIGWSNTIHYLSGIPLPPLFERSGLKPESRSFCSEGIWAFLSTPGWKKPTEFWRSNLLKKNQCFEFLFLFLFLTFSAKHLGGDTHPRSEYCEERLTMTHIKCMNPKQTQP